MLQVKVKTEVIVQNHIFLWIIVTYIEINSLYSYLPIMLYFKKNGTATKDLEYNLK